MATAAQHGLDEIVHDVRGKQFGTLTASSVRVEDVEEADGLVTIVTVGLTSSERDGSWDSQDFLQVRRFTRTVAADVLGSDRALRMLYVEDQGPGDRELDPEDEPAPGDKSEAEQF